MKGDAVADIHSAKTAQERSKLVDAFVKLLIGDRLGLLGFWLWNPNKSCLVTRFRKVTIDTVDARVQPATDEPLPKWRIARIQRGVPVLIPGEQVRVLFKTVGEVLLAEPLADTRVAGIRLSDELRWRGEVILLAPVHRDLGFSDLHFHCHWSTSD